MDAFLSPLLQKAFSHAPASEANEAIDRVRKTLGGPVRSFEAVVPDGAGTEWLRGTLLPRLVYHLDSLGIRPPRYSGVFASLFVGDELYFVQMMDLMEFAAARLELGTEQMHERWGAGEASHRVPPEAGESQKARSSAPLALPAGNR